MCVYARERECVRVCVCVSRRYLYECTFILFMLCIVCKVFVLLVVSLTRGSEGERKLERQTDRQTDR
jgi:hypothetical protein